ncbi:ead/Ea22-like family protein [Salmonella enterica subsp. enterica serovar Brandenburg]|nr:ead/Ea22-like family protein [Salmonella enterica subsp. enterica serovar Schwarzengrund]EMC1192350.1 ead/Ea22-like family protein [Salmonella enterica]
MEFSDGGGEYSDVHHITLCAAHDKQALPDELEANKEQIKTLESRNRRLEGIIDVAEKRIAEQSTIVDAAEKLVRCKGRYHSELNYRALAELFGITTPDLPPLEHENVHYADAAEMEIAALRQRIAELEARMVTLPEEKFCASDYVGSQYWEETEVWNKAISACAVAIRAAGIGVKGE